jgi:hypothetical protein
MMPKQFIGDRAQVEDAIYEQATKKRPMGLLFEFQYDFNKIAKALANGLSFEAASWKGGVIQPDQTFFLGYLKSHYEAAISSQLQRLGVGIEADDINGLRPFVKSYNRQNYFCRLATQTQGRDYDLGALLESIESIDSANFKSIWELIDRCEINEEA